MLYFSIIFVYVIYIIYICRVIQCRVILIIKIMNLATEKLPKNISRNLVQLISGEIEFSFYKDGMFKIEGDENWTHPSKIYSWISIQELRELIEV